MAEAAARIAALTGLERGPTQVRQFLKALGRFFTGAPTDQVIWMLVVGVAASIGGVVGLVA